LFSLVHWEVNSHNLIKGDFVKSSFF
jgi:hypothetical protein